MQKIMMALGLCLLSFSVGAGVWEERALLERYVKQLESLNATILAQAEQARDKDARLQLDYEALRSDTDLITQKLRHYLNTPNRDFEVRGRENAE